MLNTVFAVTPVLNIIVQE